MRLFLAIDPPPDLGSALQEALLPWRHKLPDWHWGAAARYHLTLRFLGETDSKLIPEIIAGMARASHTIPAFTLSSTSWGFFPRPAAATLFWLGWGERDSDFLSALAKAANEHIACGERDNRPYSPHLTLARSRTPQTIALAQLTALPLPTILWPVDSWHLYQSQLGSGPPRYLRLHSQPLHT
ncbi:RNA 2',3'-cyclic phosphodiesterase [Candidatus Magnetaquicoccus inordinatus]|uniref:RNA 2',3'-cyclic phosphodiesterase n=1 Tax=Candidatus Magnetaquicoccus inordinatus TaxID=2496818 RepID=UPI001D0DC97B|nr:RNA 2',3'-cyclic phosphodiesterase [Candidatus Magnetaquicoccus inordinatus]